MTENEAKEIVKKLRNKAELFKNSGFAVDGIVKSFEDSANAIETLSEEIQQYRAIGTIEEFKALKERNKPEKPLFVPTDDTCLYQEYRCPSCNEWLADKFKPYRCKCGQKLDWQ